MQEEQQQRIVAIRSLPLVVLMVLALLWVCNVAKEILIPVAIACVLQALFAPLVQALARRRVPQSVAALLIVGTLLGVFGSSVYYLSEPTLEWLEQVPRSFNDLEFKLETLKAPMQDMRKATEQVERLATLDEEGGQLEVSLPPETSLLSTVFDQASSLLVSGALTLTLLFLLLVQDGSFLRNLVRILPRLKQKKQATRIVRGFQDEISAYLRTITLINAILGLSVGLAMWALGMPSPVLWGVMAALFNYVPYAGAAAGVCIVAFVALLTFDSPGQAIAAPVSYLLLTLLEGGVITPAVIGRTLVLSPVVVLVWLVLWGWLWGIAGALLAVPLLMAVKILCEQIPSLKPLGVLLSRGNRPKPGARQRAGARARSSAPTLLTEEMKTLQAFADAHVRSGQ